MQLFGSVAASKNGPMSLRRVKESACGVPVASGFGDANTPRTATMTYLSICNRFQPLL